MVARPSVSPVRVAHLVQYLEVGGIERMVLALSRAGRAHGVESEVVAYLGEGPFREAFREAGVETTVMPSGSGLKPALGPRLAAWLRRRRIDVLHSHHLGPFLYGSIACLLARKPHLHTEHSVELYDVPRRRLLARLMPRAARVVSVSPGVADWRRTHLGTAAEVVENGVALPPPPSPETRAAARRGLGILDGAFVVGTVARLAPEKDLGTLLRAFSTVVAAFPDARLVLAGGGAERPVLEALSRTLGLDASVLFLGERRDVEALLPAFDVTALSSVREGLPLSLLEAMAAGLPAVATEVGGLPDLLSAGGGRLVPPSSPETLAGALLDYARDPARRLADGLAARARVEARHGEDAMVRRYVDLYRQLAGRDRRP